MGIFENEVPVNVKSSHQKESRSAEVNQRYGFLILYNLVRIDDIIGEQSFCTVRFPLRPQSGYR